MGAPSARVRLPPGHRVDDRRPSERQVRAAAGRIIDAPGPVVVTSIRGDLIDHTAGLRQQVGTLHVFNPEGVGEYGSTFRWNPVAGCTNMQTAIRRAGHMVEAVEASGLTDATFWSDQAVQVLSSFMHAADLYEGGTLATVYAWLVGDSPVPLEILDTALHAEPAAAAVIRRFRSLPPKTRQSVELTCRNVLRFMTLPEIAQAVMPDPRIPEFVISDFLQSRDTLYLSLRPRLGRRFRRCCARCSLSSSMRRCCSGHGCRRAGSTRRCPWSSTRSPT
ncbi:type IV secretory system conjugative DNA transfer family protein [Thermostaphylospora chromogena]|uniref:type IV secretory system conjugative DNA transfer family protein n=1 Tax=Thermostaphylospora chromogena TaxID=35622 RepID=UPI0010421204|nr:type IV secretory system conjugative DNA transfer family protein [Thermostaphylospora chromogena]